MKKTSSIFFLFFTLSIFSQKITVINGETGKAIDAVAIYNKAKTASSVTNEAGIVEIADFKNEEVIYFSHVSYALFKAKKKNIIKNNFKVYLSKESEELDEVVVSVFKNKAKTNRIAEQVAIINKKEIQKISPQTSADLLANIPGIKVQKSQFGGGSPVLRGLESNRVLLVVDGVRMNNAIYRKGHLQNSITVSPSLLERTEVVFGPSSVIYGSDALGGVIHYYTKTPSLSEKKQVKGNILSRFSTANSEVTNSGSLEIQFPKWSSLTNVTYSDYGDLRMGKKRSHGFEDWGKIFYYSENTPDLFVENQTENTDPNVQRNTGFNQLDVLQKFYVPLSKNTDFNLNIQYSTSSDVPRFDRLTETVDDGTLKFAEWYYGPQKRLLISPQLAIQPKKKWLESGTFTLAYQNIQESRINRKFGSLEKTFREENVDVYSFNGDFTVPLAKKRDLGYGVEVAYNDVTSTPYGRTINVNGGTVTGFDDALTFPVQSRYADGGSSYLSTALYTSYRQDISKNSTLNTGVRFTYTNLQASWIDDTFLTLPDDVDLSNKALTATIGYVFKPTKSWQLNTVISSGFRSPNIDDVGKIREKNGDVTVPNVSLEPEYAYNAEIGVQKYFNDRKFRVGANVYYTLLNNYIYREDYVFNGSSTIIFDGEEENVVANVNKGNAYVTGFTASYQGKLHENFTTSGSVTFTEGRTYDTDETLSSIPPIFGNFDINYSNNKIEAGISLRFNGRKKISDYNLEEGIDNQNQSPIVNAAATEDVDIYYGTPSWVTLSLYGKYTINKNFALQGRLNNVFDQHYKEFASSISAPGRDFSLSLFVNF